MRRFIHSVCSGHCNGRVDRAIALAFLSVALSCLLSLEATASTVVRFDNAADANATITESTETAFSGTGVNDATFSGKLLGPATTFTVQINGAGNPNTFQWKKGTGAFSATINVSTSPQILSDGISIGFGATTGHILNDSWTFTVSPMTATLTGFTVGNNTDRFLMAAISISSGDFHVESVETSAALGSRTLIPLHQTESGGVPTRSEHWGTSTSNTPPDAGTGSVTITFVRSSGSTSTFDYDFGVVSLYGVNQATPVRSTGGLINNSVVAVNGPNGSQVGDAVVVSLAAREGAGAVAEYYFKQTPRWNNAGSGSTALVAYGSTMPGEGSPRSDVGYTLTNAVHSVVSVTTVQPWNDTLVRLESFGAFQTSAGVALRWRSGHEASNLGYNVYREENGVRTLVNRSLISGSALLVGPQTELSQGRTYRWADPKPADSSVRYWLEAIDLNGEKTTFGPAFVERASNQVEDQMAFVQAASLETLGHCSEEVTPQPGISAAEPSSALASGRSVLASGDASLAENRARWALPAGAAAKIGVTREGWYRVSSASLAEAGFDLGMDSSRLQLFADGVEVPIIVREGKNRHFGPIEAIEFYGTSIDTPNSGERVYWLVRGRTQGKRVNLADPKKPSAALTASFPFTVERKDRTIYFAALTNNGDASNFFGPVVSEARLDQTLTVASLHSSAGENSVLRVTLQGVTKATSHVVDVLLNGKSAGTVSFKDQERSTATLSVPAAFLVEGSNTVSLVARGGSTDVSLVDTISLTYPHRFVADSGALKLTSPGGAPLVIAGFADPSVRIVDITDPLAVNELAVTTSDSAGSFKASAVVPDGGSRTLLALTASRVLAPASVTANRPSSLRSDTGKADLAVIANGRFLAAATTLEVWREAQGLSVKVVDVEDIYDEFNFGHKSPYAIQSYLRLRQTLGTRYVLFVGDSTIDPRDFLGLGNSDLVPTKLVATKSLKSASDDWFVDFDSDGLPDMAAGRLSVRTAAEAATAVNKLKAYDQNLSSTDSWRRSVVQIADRDNPPEVNSFSFEKKVGTLSLGVPAGFAVQDILVREVGAVAAHDSIVSRINSGARLVTYIGHGTQDSWSKSHIFDDVDGAALTNGNKLPIVISMNCLNGQFEDVYADSFAEVLQKAPGGGAAAVWASSSMTGPDPQGQLVTALYDELWGSSSERLGDATTKAKAATIDSDVRRTWILFGDPTMKLR